MNVLAAGQPVFDRSEEDTDANIVPSQGILELCFRQDDRSLLKTFN
ncbi:MAG: hypothetical protein PHZ11_05715 [Desulfitobacteriaceae bacterium]|nr:hypothetical protein [Desulfitobacteriaceae bacterium]MDD4346381.1 hypothetical protein [Desulfitobacteriaceae bacterium]MDD4400934.1 hypothetical protein [Desulfitobacteriaceae bacterium]